MIFGGSTSGVGLGDGSTTTTIRTAETYHHGTGRFRVVAWLLHLLILILGSPNSSSSTTTTITLVDAILHVPTNTTSYRSIPAAYYGKPWKAHDYITMRLQYFGSTIDWCREADRLFSSIPTSINPIVRPPDGNPVALLLDDDAGRSDEIGHYPCHLVDYERVAQAWNVSYIIFYDAVKDRPLQYISTYLDDRIVSETNAIGYQLVTHQTGLGEYK
jgi:hypothetical protein